MVANIRRAGSEMKHNNTLCYGNKSTFISITGACTLTIVHSVFSVKAGLVVEMLFILFSVYNTA